MKTTIFLIGPLILISIISLSVVGNRYF